jgi:hypothetical protein
MSHQGAYEPIGRQPLVTLRDSSPVMPFSCVIASKAMGFVAADGAVIEGMSLLIKVNR